MNTSFFKTYQGTSLDKDGVSSLGYFDPQTTDGNSGAFTPTIADSPASSVQARLSSLPASARPTTPPSYDLGPTLPTQHAVESLRAPVCLTLGELCALCDEVGLHDEGARACPPTAMKLIASNAPFLAATQRGCPALIRVYQRVDAFWKSVLAAHLLAKLAVLAMDAYGNYMVQCVIEASDMVIAARYVTQFFAGHLLRMSCDKFASNVVEKVIRRCGGDGAVNRLLLDELIFNPAAGRGLVSDRYGNFVVQSVVSTVSTLAEIGSVARILSPLLSRSRYATNIWAKVTKRRHELSQPLLTAAATAVAGGHPPVLHATPSLPAPFVPRPQPHQHHQQPSAAAESAADSPPKTPLTPWSAAFQPAVSRAACRDLSGGRYSHCPYSFVSCRVHTEDTVVFPRVRSSSQPRMPGAEAPTLRSVG